MMSVLERPHRISDTGAETTKPDLRLVLPPSPTPQGVVDGSWWPRTRDPAAELPGRDNWVAVHLASGLEELDHGRLLPAPDQQRTKRRPAGRGHAQQGPAADPALPGGS
jgi:hypothetical protein